MSVVYWEKQGNDLLCGVHCINSLLQGPFFNEVDLALIAQELDQYEKNLLKQGGMESKDFLEFVGGDSHNVEDGGNYSIQVLEKAINKYKLKCKNINANELLDQDLSSETGFICHNAMHWYAVRKVDGVWYNLNSLYKTGPRSISDFYLSALLVQFQEQGQNIFLITGQFPDNQKLIDKMGFEKHQKLVLSDEIQPYKQVNNKSLNKKKDDDFSDFIEYSNDKAYNLRSNQKNQGNKINYREDSIDYDYDLSSRNSVQKNEININQRNKQNDSDIMRDERYDHIENKDINKNNNINININNNNQKLREMEQLCFYKLIQEKNRIKNNQNNSSSSIKNNNFYSNLKNNKDNLNQQQNEQNKFINYVNHLDDYQDKSSDYNYGDFNSNKKSNVNNQSNNSGSSNKNNNYNNSNQKNNSNRRNDSPERQLIEEITLTIWFNSQIKYSSEFHPFHTIEDIHTFIKQKDKKYTQKKFVLYTNNPDRMFFNNKEKFISDYGLYSGQILHIKEL